MNIELEIHKSRKYMAYAFTILELNAWESLLVKRELEWYKETGMLVVNSAPTPPTPMMTFEEYWSAKNKLL